MEINLTPIPQRAYSTKTRIKTVKIYNNFKFCGTQRAYSTKTRIKTLMSFEGLD